VIYETTLPLGTTRNRFAPALTAASGLAIGDGLLLCHSPERVSSGTVFRDLRRYPKLVGGVDAASAAAAITFYERALEFDERDDLPRANGVWDLGSAEAAEMAKLAETTYRDINIAFANELAVAADHAGVDVRRVIEAANSQPYSHIHRPGIAVGGHCIPVYPWFLMRSMEGVQLPALARAVNDGMPAYAVDAVAGHLGGLNGRTVAIFGLAYRGDVKEAAFSGTFGVAQRIEELGGAVVVHDPLFTDDEIAAHGFRPHALGGPVDAVVIQADHRAYGALTVDDLGGARVLLDGRGMIEPARLPGVTVLRIGAPAT
jgi:nucleotide sugar dehydrogenase